MITLPVNPETHPSLWIVLHPDSPLRDGATAFRAESQLTGRVAIHPRERAERAISELRTLVEAA